MRVFTTIESWASSVGYVVESDQDGLFWHREGEAPRPASSVAEVLDSIIREIRESYKGAE